MTKHRQLLIRVFTMLFAVLVWQAAFGQGSLDSDVKKLKDDYAALRNVANPAQDAIIAVNKYTGYTSSIIGIPHNTRKACDKILDIIGPFEVTLSVVEVIPETHDGAVVLKQRLDPLRKKLQKVRDYMQPKEEKLKPINDPLQKFYYATLAVRVAVAGYLDGLGVYVTTAEDAAKIIQLTKNKEQAEKELKLRTSINNTDKHIVAVTNALKTLNSEMNKFLDLVKQIAPYADPLVEVGTDIEKVSTDLDDVDGPLKDVAHALNEKVKIKFPYPNPSLKHPFRISHYTFKISVEEAIKGSHEIEKKIEHALSSTLWKALKFFGLSKAINSLKDDADHILHKALSKLHLNIKLDIPGLDDVESKMAQVEKLAPDLGKYVADATLYLTAKSNLDEELPIVQELKSPISIHDPIINPLEKQ